MEPNRGSTSVAADAPVRVLFDRPVDHASVAGRFSVSPGIPGCDLGTVFGAGSTAPCWIHWLTAPAGFELVHQGAVFAPATQYTFTLAGGFADETGDRNDLDHHWDLTSAVAPRLTATTPGDRADGVALDSPLVLSFSAPMDAPATAAAIVLEPPVPGTRVLRNLVDHGRFAVLPGQLLDPHIEYTLTVAAGARGEDGGPVVAPPPVHFTTGSRLAGPHAVVLAGVPGGPSTEVLLPALAPQAGGEPPAAPVLMRAPLCAIAAGCGPVSPGAPLRTYTAAAVSGDGSHIAVVIHDEVSGASRVEVVTTVDDTIVADIGGAQRPSWSPDGSQLAVATAAGVAVLDVRLATVTVVAPGTAVAASPLWSGASTLVLSTATPGGLPAAVELLNRDLDARYPLPSSPATAVAEAVSPGGRLAVATPDAAVTVLSASASPQRLAGRLDAVGFAGEGTLVAVAHGTDAAQLVRISVLGGDSTAVQLAPGADLQSVRVAPDGRRLVWLGLDSHGVRQALVANADGSGSLALTRFLAGDLEAQSIAFAAQ